MMNHAEVIREALINHVPATHYELFPALAALAALTRELAETKAAADASQAAFDADLEAGRADLEATIAAQAERLAASQASDAESIAMYRRARDERDKFKALAGGLAATIAAQGKRIATLEEALERIKGHTCPDMAPGTPAPDPRWIHAIARAALAPKEAQG